MKLRLLAAGRLRQAPMREAASDYADRISRILPIEVVEVPASAGGEGRAPAEESERITRKLRRGARVVLLDERGRQFSTAQLSKRIEGWMNSSVDVDLIVGGAHGVTDALRERADDLWALSELTLPHELARVIALEAVYRALTVIRNLPYHHR